MFIAETPRLVLRELTLNDAGALGEILGDPEVMEFSTNGPCTDDDTRKFIDGCLTSYKEHGFGQWGVVDSSSGAIIGFCGLSPVDLNGVQEVEIGYRLARNAWGRGLASEAAAAALAYGFSKCGLDSIIAIIAHRHVASVRVAEKVGLKMDFSTTYRGWDVGIWRKKHEEWNTRKPLTEILK